MLISLNVTVFFFSFLNFILAETKQLQWPSLQRVCLKPDRQKDNVHTQRLLPCIQRKVKALTSTTQWLCLNFCPASVGRFIETLRYHSTQMQVVNSYHGAWKCLCPSFRSQLTQRMDILLTFTPRFPSGFQQYIHSCIRLMCHLILALFTLWVILITLSSMSK